MKSTNWIFNGVLAVAVVILYILHFTGSNTPIKTSAVGGAGTKVAYFEIDSIQNSYEFFSTRTYKKMAVVYLRQKLEVVNKSWLS